ncbi:MFS transporter [Streptomyces sp. HNM0574]|uniref:MFS transporter n=1 Tax=Streptomyces sp. HNM0574 TaxID=2714954 RepID=UPI00146D711F|nr:MFS transporter [Streptomyces sp. HNM0574]NLU66752.1 MFS transporter [Streptomyces sp. HNM0574]
MPAVDTKASTTVDAAFDPAPSSTPSAKPASPTTAASADSASGRPADPEATKLSPGDPGHSRMRLALFAAGLATFALLYSTQALLPEISHSLGATPDQASWTVSGATIGLAVAVLPLAALSERFGRRRMLTVSMTVAVALALVIPFAPSLGALIALRTAQGAAIAGVPASAMAFLSDEVRSRHLVGAIGLFVAGNSVGGMSGRILTGWVTQAWGWRAGLAAVALTSLLALVAYQLLVPRARNFTPAPLNPRAVARTVGRHLRNPLLVRLYVIGGLFMTVFGAVYTTIGYRLVAEPFGLSQGLVGSIFVIYLVGTAASATAGRLNSWLGRRGTLYLGIGTASAGLLLSLADNMAAVVLGLVLITAGFFAGHSVASGSVSQTATEGKAQASALYQMAYYLGSSVGGALGAAAFASAGWSATVALTLTAMTLAAGVTLYATRRAVVQRRAVAA